MVGKASDNSGHVNRLWSSQGVKPKADSEALETWLNSHNVVT